MGGMRDPSSPSDLLGFGVRRLEVSLCQSPPPPLFCLAYCLPSQDRPQWTPLLSLIEAQPQTLCLSQGGRPSLPQDSLLSLPSSSLSLSKSLPAQSPSVPLCGGTSLDSLIPFLNPCSRSLWAIHLSPQLFTWQTSTECLPHAKPWMGCWGCRDEPTTGAVLQELPA